MDVKFQTGTTLVNTKTKERLLLESANMNGKDSTASCGCGQFVLLCWQVKGGKGTGAYQRSVATVVLKHSILRYNIILSEDQVAPIILFHIAKKWGQPLWPGNIKRLGVYT